MDRTPPGREDCVVEHDLPWHGDTKSINTETFYQGEQVGNGIGVERQIHCVKPGSAKRRIVERGGKRLHHGIAGEPVDPGALCQLCRAVLIEQHPRGNLA